VIKVSSNSCLYQRWKGNIDVNTGSILDGRETLESLGRSLFEEILELASGKLTKAEILGHHEFAIHTIAPTV
jgi:altronate dehydratase large subunit